MNQHRWTRRYFVYVLCLSFVLSYAGYLGREAFGDERPTHPDIEPNTFEFLSYQASDYRFQIIPLDKVPSELEDFLRRLRETLPPDLEDFLTQIDFDDTDFLTGSAAFGSGGECPLQETVRTDWPVESQLLVRRVVEIPAEATGIRILVAADNDIVGVFFNGAPLTEHTLGADIIAHDGCPILDEFRFDVPPDLVQPGPNLVALYVLDRGVESFLDAKILAELPSAGELPELPEGTQTFPDEVTAPSPDEVTAPDADLDTTFPPGGPEVPPGPPTVVSGDFYERAHDESVHIPGETPVSPQR